MIYLFAGVDTSAPPPYGTRAMGIIVKVICMYMVLTPLRERHEASVQSMLPVLLLGKGKGGWTCCVSVAETRMRDDLHFTCRVTVALTLLTETTTIRTQG